MNELFASPLKELPNGKRFKISLEALETPPRSPKKCDDRLSKSSTKKLFPVFDKQAWKSASEKKSPKTLRRIRPKKSKKLLQFNAKDQYALDFGQKDFDAIKCKTCNMLYTVGEVVDEQTHADYHDTFVNGVKFNGWKNEDVVNRFDDGRVIRVLPEYKTKHSYMFKKVNDLFDVADLELGIRVDINSCMSESSIYLLFVTNDKRIAGFVAAEGITKAWKLVQVEPNFAIGKEEFPARCGVSRLWVHHRYRRHKVATRLLDLLRIIFIPGKVIPKSELAFSDPNPSGYALAKSYTGLSNFLISQFYDKNDFDQLTHQSDLPL